MKRYITALLITVLGPSPALAEAITCPPSIKVEEKTFQTPPQGWTLNTPETERPFVIAEFYDGSPEGTYGALGPSYGTETKNEFGVPGVLVWNFQSPEQKIWISCRYRDTSLKFTRPLPAYKECRVDMRGASVKVNCE
jgi:hypothetical protein